MGPAVEQQAPGRGSGLHRTVRLAEERRSHLKRKSKRRACSSTAVMGCDAASSCCRWNSAIISFSAEIWDLMVCRYLGTLP